MKQEHTPQGVVHLPLPEQALGHGEKCVNADEESVGYWATRMKWRSLVVVAMDGSTALFVIVD